LRPRPSRNAHPAVNVCGRGGGVFRVELEDLLIQQVVEVERRSGGPLTGRGSLGIEPARPIGISPGDTYFQPIAPAYSRIRA